MELDLAFFHPNQSVPLGLSSIFRCRKPFLSFLLGHFYLVSVRIRRLDFPS